MTGHDFDASDDPVGAAVERGLRMRAMSEQSTVVLVHGAWHGAWCWDDVVSRLSGDGFDVVAVDLPSVVSGGDLYDDARAVRQVLDDTPGDKVVVGHSYGGIVITEAAAGAEGVRHLVYLTAFMLDEGQSLADVAGAHAARMAGPEPRRQDDERRGRAGGLLQHVRAGDRRRRRRAPAPAHDRLVRRSPCARSRWRDVPSTYVICDLDHAIPVPAQEAMSAHAGTTHRLPSDHSPFLTDPDAVADLDPRRRIAVQSD